MLLRKIMKLFEEDEYEDDELDDYFDDDDELDDDDEYDEYWDETAEGDEQVCLSSLCIATVVETARLCDVDWRSNVYSRMERDGFLFTRSCFVFVFFCFLFS